MHTAAVRRKNILTSDSVVKVLVWCHSVDAVLIIFTRIMWIYISPAKILKLHHRGHRTSCTKRNSNTGNYIPNLSCKHKPDYESKTKHTCTLQHGIFIDHIYSVNITPCPASTLISTT